MISAIAGSSNTAPNGSPFAAVDKGFQCRAPPMITRRIDAASATHGAVAARQRAGATSCCAAVIVEDEDPPATDRARAPAAACARMRSGREHQMFWARQGSVPLCVCNSLSSLYTLYIKSLSRVLNTPLSLDKHLGLHDLY